MKWTPCECTVPGWCERHQCRKSDFLFQQCQASQEWFDQWEQHRGPCIPMASVSVDADGPSLAQRAVNFGAAVVRHVANGMQRVDQEMYDARISICQHCTSCNRETMVCREPACGCSLMIKAWWSAERCPRSQWPSDAVPDG